MTPPLIRRVYADHALLPGGWAEHVSLEVGEDGHFSRVQAGSTPAPDALRLGTVLPGALNLHSHAFQRAFAGLTERRSAGTDTFWTWREAMYAAVQTFTPDQQLAVARMLYVELLEAGFTSVGEFHYLHGSAPHDSAAAIVQAARETGLGLTLLPVLYRTGNSGAPVRGGQTRFFLELDQYAALVTADHGPSVRVGVAPHSLRAVPPQDWPFLLDLIAAQPTGTPIHIHVSEQRREVEECRAALGTTPIRWLLDHAPVDGRWCLVHATHATPEERREVAARGAVVSLNPTTEASLGDGFFALESFVEEGGRWGIGTDSHVGVDPFAELRLLESGARLRLEARNVAARPGQHTGEALYRRADGAAVLGRPVGALEPGRQADLLALNPDHPQLADLTPAEALDAAVFSADRPVKDVLVGGRHLVRDGRHLARDAAEAAFRPVRSALARHLRERT